MIKEFIGRKEELVLLEKLYEKSKNQAQFLVIYGKRRVGKTELVKHFFNRKPYIYYLASRTTAADQLKTASGQIAEFFNAEYLKSSGFSNWRELFDFLGERLKDNQEPPVLVFDEFPYLVESDKGMSSFFQYGWDERLKQAKVFLILLGSSIAMMRRHALAYNAPLYGRRTGSLKLDPFSFTQAKVFYPAADFTKTVSFYGLGGGLPAYLREFDGKKTVVENISEKILTKGSLLYTEPELLISEELEEPQKYLTLLKAIGFNRTKFGEIVNASGLKANIVSKYLAVLINLGWVNREVPVTEKLNKKSKRGIYVLADNYLKFYYSLVFPYVSLLESGEKRFLLEKISQRLPGLFSRVYEAAAKEFTVQLWQKKLTPVWPLLGRWWDKNTEIDLVGLNEEENAILFGEAKWNIKPLEAAVLGELKQKAKSVNWGKENRREYFVLAAKGGFSPELIKIAKKEGVFLIKEDKLIEF
ncbi:MAG: ATP-binding protein [Parcubacteria group bacterium CG10_big_fil_rev_8_21_14_0_10_41_35]|nr:MAG: ATP-binding protein [Parcubacteria group bacterium CG10_big_fil_rev_8_21_14_0_10_41_35]